MSQSDTPHRSQEPEEKTTPHKIFVTNLDVEIPIPKLEEDLRAAFSKYGKLQSVVAKKSFNNEYCFAFIDFRQGEDASSAVAELNGTYLGEKKMKVELQDNARRRRGVQSVPAPKKSENCFVCGKSGHFARHCKLSKDKSPEKKSKYKRRRSDSEPSKKHKKKKHRRSSSSESESSKKKQKKKHSKKIKKSSKHKHKNYSDSDSSN